MGLMKITQSLTLLRLASRLTLSSPHTLAAIVGSVVPQHDITEIDFLVVSRSSKQLLEKSRLFLLVLEVAFVLFVLFTKDALEEILI
jgi:hypothetical protein